jgi:hypothetical protein
MAAPFLGRQASTLKFCMPVPFLDRRAEDNLLLRLVQGRQHRGCCLYIVSMATAIQSVVNIDLLDLYLNKQTGDQ